MNARALFPVGTMLLVGALACAPRAFGGAARSAPTTGLEYRHLTDPTGPWAIDVMDVDLRACWRPVAVKAGRGAIGRATTSALLRELADTGRRVVGGGVNADFFLFAPPGVPVGPHVGGGRVINGPGDRDAIWFDAKGRATIGRLAARGFVRIGQDSLALDSWNRRDGAVRFIDRSWGDSTVAARGMVEVVVGGTPARVLAVDTSEAPVAIPAAGGVIQLDSTVARAVRERVAHAGGAVRWQVALAPTLPREAVGGNPALLRDSVELPGLEKVGGANFGPVRHPRTAIGIASRGRRLLFVTVDGRQAGWSAGMTLRELAALMLRLGATDAINLDGGGSTAMVVRRGDTLRVMNRPSDATGERPVANVLAVAKGC